MTNSTRTEKKTGTELRMERLGSVIDAQKRRLRYTQAELSRLSGLCDQTLMAIRKGGNTSIKSIMELCDILKLDMKFVDRTTGEEYLI